jgi:hypothetical protein
MWTAIQLVRPSLKLVLLIIQVQVRTWLSSSRVQLTTSLSIWKTPASTVYGLSVLLGRSVLKARRRPIGVGFKTVYCDLSVAKFSAFALVANRLIAAAAQLRPAKGRQTRAGFDRRLHLTLLILFSFFDSNEASLARRAASLCQESVPRLPLPFNDADEVSCRARSH